MHCSAESSISARMVLPANKLMQVEAGLSDLRQAYAELHEQLDSGQEEKPPEEQQHIRQHVSTLL